MDPVRPATPEDAAAVAAVHAEGVATGRATLDAAALDVAGTAARIAATRAPYAFLVREDGGQVAGWAATFAYSPRAAYAGVAEFSVYVAGAAAGRGHGRALLTALLQQAEAAGLHKVVGRLLAGNTASRALCAAVGFREVGVHLRHGRVGGAWHDVVVVERLLVPSAGADDLREDRRT